MPENKIVKSLALTVVSLILFIGSWLYLQAVMFTDVTAEAELILRLLEYVGPFLLLLISSAVLALTLLFVRTRLIFWSAVLLHALAIWIVLPNKVLTGIAALIFLFGIAVYGGIIRDERKERVHFSLRRILRVGLVTFLTVTFLVIAIDLFYSFNERKVTSQYEVPDWMVEASLEAISPLASSQVPGFSSDMLVEEFLVPQRVTAELDSITVPLGSVEPDLAKDIEQQKELVRKRALAESKKNFESSFGVIVSEGEPVRDVFARIINDRINSIMASQASYVPIAASLGLFAVLQALRWPIGLIITFFAWLGYLLLRALGFLTKSTDEKAVDVVRMP